MQSNWPAQHCKALREHHARGLPYSAIAAAINAKFKTAYSRNATIGRAKRMGLSNPNPPKNLPARWPRRRGKAAGLHKPRERHAPEFITRMPVAKRTEAPKLRCVELVPRHLSLLDLEASDCRYPYGGEADGEAITFCGHPRREDSSYCTPHFHLTRGPGVLYRQPKGKAALRLVEGGIKRDLRTTPTSTAIRMQSLSPGHRAAHLQALIRQLPIDTVRRARLEALLREEMTGFRSRKGRAI